MPEVSTSDYEKELVLTRLFDAPREIVWKAWTDPARLAQWWGPSGFTNPVCRVDVRPGGTIFIEMRAPDGARHPMAGEFREVAPPQRLVFVSAALDPSGKRMFEVLNTVTFADEGGKTRLTMHAQVLTATPAATQHLKGMRAGWTQSLERLSDVVSQ